MASARTRSRSGARKGRLPTGQAKAGARQRGIDRALCDWPGEPVYARAAKSSAPLAKARPAGLSQQNDGGHAEGLR
jgi:hypothetical protein